MSARVLPSYLSALLYTYQTLRTHRTPTEKLLKILKCSLKSFGEHSFSFNAPSVSSSHKTTVEAPVKDHLRRDEVPHVDTIYTYKNITDTC